MIAVAYSLALLSGMLGAWRLFATSPVDRGERRLCLIGALLGSAGAICLAIAAYLTLPR